MSKPFQFTMRRMFGAVVLLTIAFRLLMLFLAMGFDSGILPPLLYFGFFVAGGAAYGCFDGRPLAWALFGAFCGLVLLPFFLPASTYPARE
jgi:hypothetical protein